jgi:hypothetical protein
VYLFLAVLRVEIPRTPFQFLLDMGADRLRTEARLSPIDKKLFWRRQFLNPYAFESAPAVLRALVELSSSPGSRLSPMNQQIRAFGKANTGHQLVRVPPTSAAMSIVRAFSITSAGSTLSRDPIRRAP